MGVTVIKYAMLQILLNVCCIKFFGIYSIMLASAIANAAFIYFRITVVLKYTRISLPTMKDVTVGAVVWLLVCILFFKRTLIYDVANCSIATIYGFHVLKETGAISELQAIIKRKLRKV